MEGALDAVHAAFLQTNRRPAVFDREIREHVGEWTLTESVPVEEIIGQFKRHPAFLLEDSKVILPVHEPGSADLTGEFLLYYPDHVVPCVVYHDYAKDDLARIPIEEFEHSYPAWRLRFWHGAFDPPADPEYLLDEAYDEGDADAAAPAGGDPVSSATPLADDGADLIEDLRSMITDQEIAAREEARNRCERLPPAQFLSGRGGVSELVTAGIDVDEYGQQVVRLRIPNDDVDGPVDLTDEYGIYPGSEVIVDSLDGHEGFPAEAEVLGTEGREMRLSFYWDRGADNPDVSVFELDSDARFLAGELLNPVPFDRKREAVDLIADDERKRGWLSGSATMSFDDGFDVTVSKARLNKFQHQAAHSALSA